MLNAGIMDNEEFEALIQSGKVCVCDFSASWCGPCRMMAPILEDVSDKYKGKYFFYQIDIDSAEDLAEKYGVSAVPTVVVFKDGKELGRISGFQEKAEFEEFLKNTIESKETK